ncbi:poly-gamma-glutamate capsule biosynthesis protein CapA/YwtB (metallophosphatase superfamily) [Breznakia sp. PF5-3]|uniref:CapA family protein n=1 Tax=unclassified Breznakia TaxID=2623764 RepID=UPI002405BC92|nr:MULTISPECIES: CapA family protein [unclassified Breznakia]MDF9823957.1 poly-gamma-glutamate capsule biosynthesis protein CapA/YwtB (metallophosphatase superfamily) [Breznakia sp. PM6-1]MDF9834756.1 poly-gamma-glutamate capsule biosynthesis protein CapA/YwtB (metallophosphatase superfamily) [Breznakia sp. PF5-3]
MKKILIVTLSFLLVACSGGKSDKVENKKEDKQEVKKEEIVDISFSAVGDNLIHEAIYYYNRDANGNYSFDDIYTNTNYLTKDADISYINQETICGGTELGLSGYPTFNGPYEILDAVHKAGFNWLSGSSNHSFDRGEQGIVNELKYLDKYPDLTVSGIQSSADAERYHIKEVDGVKVGMIGYTYGLNGFELPAGKEYLVNLIDLDVIKADMEQLNQISDIQVVSMHWGEEYQLEENAEQEELAQYLSDLGVDVIIGGHPHVIQPMDYLKGENGNETLVIYSLGNFLSAQDVNYRMLGGMARWTIKYNKTTKAIAFDEVAFWPTVTYISDNFKNYRTYVLKDYTDELAKTHTLTSQNQDVTRQYFIDLVESVMNDKVEIIY